MPPQPSSSWPEPTYTGTYAQGPSHLQSRHSLPTLHTRSSFAQALDYDGHDNSPVDAYTYASTTIPRQDSFASTYSGLENYRSWSTTGSISAPLTATYGEQHPAYSFGSLQAPSYSQGPSTRLPSVSLDPFSPLSMGSLQSSLPTQTVQERRLPAPYTPQFQQYSAPEVPEIRPLTSFGEPRVHINGIYSRNAMPWSQDGASDGSCSTSINSTAGPNGLPTLPQVTTATMTEPAFGYQFNVNNNAHAGATADSPDVSPTSGPLHARSFTSATSRGSSTTSMLPPSTNTLHYSSSVAPTAPSMISDEQQQQQQRPSSSRDSDQAGLYSFSTDNGTGSTETASNDPSYNNYTRWTPTMSSQSQPSLRQPQASQQPQDVRRQSSFEQQRAATVQRMSVSNLNAHY